jgi:tetratricopeptide (TPR) repeat protein
MLRNLLAASLCLLAGSALAGPLPSALSDLQEIPAASDLQCPKNDDAEPLAADAPPEIAGLVGGASLTYEQALGNVKAALEGSVSPRAISALEASTAAKDPATASRIAAIAMGAQKPLAAVAYSIKAHEDAPAEPLWLSNLSAVANYYGLHREALAFAQKAETLPNKLPPLQQGMLLNNKGYALNALGRPQEAQAALQEAIRLAPELQEAYTNLAYSLGAQDKCDQAVRYLRAGRTRRPAEVLKSNVDGPTRLPLSQVLDLSKGKPGILPKLPYPNEPADAEGVKKQLDKLAELYKPDGDKFQEHYAQAMQGMMARRMQWAQEGISGTLTANFAEALMKIEQLYTMDTVITYQAWLGGAEQALHPDPELREPAKTAVRTHAKLIRTVIDEDQIWNPRTHAINKEHDEATQRCQKAHDQGSCQALADLKMNSAMCALGKELGGKRKQAALAYEHALRELYTESFRRASAVAAYFSDPAHKAWSKLMLEYYQAATFGMLLNGPNGVADMLGRVAANCEAANRTPMDILFDRLKQLAEECQPSPPSTSVSVGVLEVSASCEKIGVTVSTPGNVGLFGSVEYQFSQRFRRLTDPRERFVEKQAGRDPDVALNLPGYGGAFDGQVTVSAGAQAGVSGPAGVGAGVKISGQTTYNNQGDITNAGGTFSVSASGPTGTGIGAGTSWTSSPGGQ